MTPLSAKLRQVWRRLSRIDLFAFLLILGGTICAFLNLNSGVASFLKFFAVLATVYAVVRLGAWWRTRLLWSLRNRLIVAYLFIAVVPILLIVTLVVVAGQILYSQLGAYLLYDDIQRRVSVMADITEHIAAAHRTLPKSISEEESERVLAAQSHMVHDQELRGLNIEFTSDPAFLRKVAGAGKDSFAGLVEEQDALYLMSVRAMPEPTGVRVVTLRVRVTPEFLATIAPDLGAIQLNLTKRFEGGTAREFCTVRTESNTKQPDGFRRETGRSTRQTSGLIRSLLACRGSTRSTLGQKGSLIRGGLCWRPLTRGLRD